MYRILIVPSGTEVGLDIFDSLCRHRDIELFGAESTDNSHAAFVYTENRRIPFVHDPDFIRTLNDLIGLNKIDYILPAHDDVQLGLLKNSNMIACPIISSSLETVSITRYKSKTYGMLRDFMPVPALYNPEDIADNMYPLFVKPDCGQGSQETYKCDDRHSLKAAISRRNDMLVCEYLPGEEITVDCFTDRDAGLLFCSARKRKRIRAGISVRSEPVHIYCVKDYAETISSVLNPFGSWFFQLKEKDGKWILLEVGARIPGGATYQRMRGVNLPLLSLFEHQRKKISILENKCKMSMDRAFFPRFKMDLDIKSLYVDFDDTIRIKGKLNAEVISLIVTARTCNVPVFLLTRNNGECLIWLRKKLLISFFDDIYLLDREASKSSFIQKGGVLIDDSFQDRTECITRGIPCFDVDAVNMIATHISRRDYDSEL